MTHLKKKISVPTELEAAPNKCNERTSINLKFSIPKCYNIKINTISQSITQILFYIQWYIGQGDMFRPSRSSSGPPTKQIRELFSFSVLWDPKFSQVSLTEAKLYKVVQIVFIRYGSVLKSQYIKNISNSSSKTVC